VLAVALSACSPSTDEPAPAATGPVPAPSAGPALSPAAAQACRALLDALPDEIDPGVTRRPVEGTDTEGDGRTAAWGDPAVVLQCGVAESDRPEEPAQVNGVLWSVRDIGAGYRWTTQNRVPAVAVDVPDAYENVAELVVPLAEPVQQAIPLPTPTP
jgi:hypothetical protein